jgi:hypothetical protein
MFCKGYCADVMNDIRIRYGKTDIRIGYGYGKSGKFAFQN